MAELESTQDRPSLLLRLLFYVGAGALLLIMTVETLAVIGRHIGWPLLGAIEIIQQRRRANATSHANHRRRNGCYCLYVARRAQ